jgi:C-methyltransferase C-terminal domain/Putative zinc binding domain/Methyltransferase domain
MYELVPHCCICQNPRLLPVVNLGELALTGVFPRAGDPPVDKGPLDLIRCDVGQGSACGLVQLRHRYDGAAMYGGNYGYRSSLNPSMVSHLRGTAMRLQELVTLESGDAVVDIGSNDGTLLSFYPTGLCLVGIDPTAAKFSHFYRPDIDVVPDFFSAKAVRSRLRDRPAKLVTSIAMFYDLPDPLRFAREVREILDRDGLWHFEQSYLPSMIEANAYDTICHEHLEYYALRQIKWITDRADLKIVALKRNSTNGGSLAVTAGRADGPRQEAGAAIDAVLASEGAMGLDGNAVFERFVETIETHRRELRSTLEELRDAKLSAIGYGASTKGNVILQYAGIGPELIRCIAEVNPEKFGCVTPGSNIPIIPEAEARAMNPDVFVVFPWHFKRHICEKEGPYLERGGRLLFPLPALEIVPPFHGRLGG